jgi:hypothetical protein
MKLYTEEQVKNFLKERTFIREETIDAMCDTLTPIELPSNEEIEKELLFGDMIEGAKWMREQIINQSK